jgi:hypothetical protein
LRQEGNPFIGYVELHMQVVGKASTVSIISDSGRILGQIWRSGRF